MKASKMRDMSKEDLILEEEELRLKALLLPKDPNDASDGDVTIAVDETITDDLTPGVYAYDFQALISGSVTTKATGKFTISDDMTRSVA